MYKALGLLKQKIADTEGLASQLQDLCAQMNVAYKGLRVGEYGSKREGFVPVYCFTVDANGYVFQINYQEGLGSFQSRATKGFSREDYIAKFEISANKPDPDMAYFNDFVLLCERLSNKFACTLIKFNSETSVWELM